MQETFHGSQQVEVPAQSHFVLEQSHDSQEELQKLAEESKKAYAGDYEEVSKSKCKRFVEEKLQMFRQQFCNHLKRPVKSEALKDFVLELNCAKIETAKNFFSVKLREMYRENRKAFFSLCYFNGSSSNIQLTNEFVFSNNLTDFNENLLRQKREIHYDDTQNDGNDRYDANNFYDDVDESNITKALPSGDEILPSASALRFAVRPSFHRHKTHNLPHEHKPSHFHHINHSPEYETTTKPLAIHNEIKTGSHSGKEPTNVIVINNSNDNHNHGSNIKQYPIFSAPHAMPTVHRPFRHHHKKPKRPHQIKVVYKKPSVKKILHVSKKIDVVLSKLGHNIAVKKWVHL